MAENKKRQTGRSKNEVQELGLSGLSGREDGVGGEQDSIRYLDARTVLSSLFNIRSARYKEVDEDGVVFYKFVAGGREACVQAFQSMVSIVERSRKDDGDNVAESAGIDEEETDPSSSDYWGTGEI